MLKTVGFPSTRTGDQTIVDGNLVIGTAGKGIDFSADPSTAGMTSELLDDYEEGTWTPSLGGDTTYLLQSGNYVKIGRQVTAYFRLRVNVLGTGTSNRFVGLPFAASADSARGLGNTNFFSGIVTSTTWLVPLVDVSTVYFAGQAAIDNSSDDVITVFQDGAYIIGCVNYVV